MEVKIMCSQQQKFGKWDQDRLESVRESTGTGTNVGAILAWDAYKKLSYHNASTPIGVLWLSDSTEAYYTTNISNTEWVNIASRAFWGYTKSSISKICETIGKMEPALKIEQDGEKQKNITEVIIKLRQEKVKLERSLQDIQMISANARCNNEDRIQKASEILGEKILTYEQKNTITNIHNNISKGVYQNWYSELRRMTEELKKAKFWKNEIRKLMENGILGLDLSELISATRELSIFEYVYSQSRNQWNSRQESFHITLKTIGEQVGVLASIPEVVNHGIANEIQLIKSRVSPVLWKYIDNVVEKIHERKIAIKSFMNEVDILWEEEIARSLFQIPSYQFHWKIDIIPCDYHIELCFSSSEDIASIFGKDFSNHLGYSLPSLSDLLWWERWFEERVEKLYSMSSAARKLNFWGFIVINKDAISKEWFEIDRIKQHEERHVINQLLSSDPTNRETNMFEIIKDEILAWMADKIHNTPEKMKKWLLKKWWVYDIPKKQWFIWSDYDKEWERFEKTTTSLIDIAFQVESTGMRSYENFLLLIPYQHWSKVVSWLPGSSCIISSLSQQSQTT